MLFFAFYCRGVRGWEEALRPKIGIITAERSMEMIREIDSTMDRFGDVIYLPYATMKQLETTYRRNIHRLDGVLFSGFFPYYYILNFVGEVLKPYAYFELADRDYYKVFTKILYRHPGIDIARVLIDRPFFEMDLREIFGNREPLYFDSFVGDVGDLESSYEKAMNRSLSLWQAGQIDLVVTRFTNLIEPLGAAGVPLELLFPSPASMLETFRTLYAGLQSLALSDALTASGLIQCTNAGESDIARIFDEISAFNESLGTAMVIRREGESIEITTSNEVLKDITRSYTDCTLSGRLRDLTIATVSIGWGLGRNILDSMQNARRALMESARNSEHSAYVVSESGELVGPLASGKSVVLASGPSPALEALGRELGIQPINLHKIANLRIKRGISRFSSAELASYLNITPRSANRILVKLAQCGMAKVTGSSQPNPRGRPSKVYEVGGTKLG